MLADHGTNEEQERRDSTMWKRVINIRYNRMFEYNFSSVRKTLVA